MRRAVAGDAGGLPLVNHLLQHTLRSLCSQQQQHFWVYSIFWRILPRNYPPPKWDSEEGPFDRSKGNKRNWILVWEDGYCDFVACSKECKEERQKDDSFSEPLQPELFFKMSHDVYNYGEGLMGKIAAERSHKWIFRDPSPEQENVPILSSWQASADSYPRTWEAQFKAGIQTIAIIAVGEGLLQLGSTKKVLQDVDFVLMLQRKFNYLQSIPGVFAQTKMTRAASANNMSTHQNMHAMSPNLKLKPLTGLKRAAQPDNNEDDEACSTFPMLPRNLAAPLNLVVPPNVAADVPSMYNSLQVLLSKLPAVTPNVGMGMVATAMNASGKVMSPTRNPLAIGCSGVSSLPLPSSNFWPESHQSLLLPPAYPPPSTNPSPSDEFESYHCLFGQPIS
ncbi:hypothetical protein GOP47_0005218 [Adiantum capillus-veneris]|uniref:Transcription factor MYC/MYB N-terminal domain-containing protein n=1 Tax=Adiantum capillus-veneris TaxID=13818 RepID=A0A9D4V4Q9_ADICA|nr:hypothetical protein GOP47_0005218 [Adiantum capillus-veneris]